MPYAKYLECQNCKKPIPLLFAKHPALLDGPTWWPKDNQPVNFLCPSCKYVYEYSVSMIRQDSLERLGVQAPSKYLDVLLVCIQCGESSCGSQVKVHVIIPLNANDPEQISLAGKEALKLMAEATPVTILCESRKHLVTAQTLRKSEEYRALFVGKIRSL